MLLDLAVHDDPVEPARHDAVAADFLDGCADFHGIPI
jgi:hypothetical protein